MKVSEVGMGAQLSGRALPGMRKGGMERGRGRKMPLTEIK